MAVRLNKALKELNVGINTVAEFLQKKGMALQDATPNAKITDEQYGLLKKEFGEDMKQNAATKQKIQNKREKEQQDKKDRQQAMKDEKERLEKEKAAKKQQFKIVGNINDMKKPAAAAVSNNAEKPNTASAASPQTQSLHDSAVHKAAQPLLTHLSKTTFKQQIVQSLKAFLAMRNMTPPTRRATASLPSRHLPTVSSRTRTACTTSQHQQKQECSSNK